MLSRHCIHTPSGRTPCLTRRPSIQQTHRLRSQHIRCTNKSDNATPGPADTSEGKESPQEPVTERRNPLAVNNKRKASSSDPISTFLTRRFGIAGGLAWLGFLAIGSLGEQVKTRLEVAAEEANTVVSDSAKTVKLPSGVTYTDKKIGGGSKPYKGSLVIAELKGSLPDGTVFLDTKARGKPIVLLYGSRPFNGGMCAGLEEAMSTMGASGRRTVQVPAALGFGEAGAVMRPTEHVPDKQGVVPSGSDLIYDVEIIRVSIPPS